jgi:transketolase N-terminal domain/subunit
LVNSNESSAYFKESQKILNHNNITPIIEAFKFHKGKIESTSFETLEEQIKRIKKIYGEKPMALFSLRYFLSEPLLTNYKRAYIPPSK